jgi:formylglycine-generating enzyme required for sulfatase activity
MLDRSGIHRWGRVAVLVGLCSGGILPGFNACLVSEHCYSDADCDAPEICLVQEGFCGLECRRDADCGEGLLCLDHRCVTRAQARDETTPSAGGQPPPLDCPEDMLNVGDSFCIDRFEASRPDATERSPGIDESRATCRRGVLPWQVDDNGEARQACIAAGKDLCHPSHWKIACEGSQRTVYGYGDSYDPLICNGIDTFGGPGSHRLLPTGSLPDCRSDWGAFDMNGNLWEHVLDGTDRTIRGGAYNCIDSQTLHRCDYIPSDWTPSARGFRCCLLPGVAGPDAGEPGQDAEATMSSDAQPTEDALPTADAVSGMDADDEADGGCLDEDSGADALVGPDSSVEPDSSVKPDSSVGADSSVKPDSSVEPDSTADAAQDAELDQSVSDAQPDTYKDADEPEDASEDTGDAAEDAGEDGATQDAQSDCPPDMVRITDYCMDIYEASRADATETSGGTSNVAASQPGVMPWFSLDPDAATALSVARSACELAGKHLCTLAQWQAACGGIEGWVYGYGNEYDPVICNGLDTYCYCDDPACSSLSICPYPRCYWQESAEGGGPCGAAFRWRPTGYFPDCVNSYGVYDINGNVWELADTTDGEDHYLGGAYNCSDSELLHRCDYDAYTWTDAPSARGFRCCKEL